MITVDEALALVLGHSQPLTPRPTPTSDALGLVIAEDVTSDIDSPPYDKSMVDGYAVRTADFADGQAELRLIEEVVAGAVATKPVSAGECTRIMTGAPLSIGADAVVMIERAEVAEFVRIPGLAETAESHPDRIKLVDQRLRPRQNILSRAASLHRGQIVLKSGRTIRPVELGLLAEVGRTTVRAIPAPRVAVLATGNELVPADRVPAGSQIRNSNGPMLTAAARQAGATTVELGIARDEPDELRSKLMAGLECDVLVVSGGVSAGVLDLVPSLLRELGVDEVFHKVRIKPGKPLWFGKLARAERSPTLVFGLPGNPLSSLVCFELFAKPAIGRLAGKLGHEAPATVSAKLAADFTHRGDRPTYHPAQLDAARGEGMALARALDWAGSADLHGFSQANALILFPAGDRAYSAGEIVSVILLDD